MNADKKDKLISSLFYLRVSASIRGSNSVLIACKSADQLDRLPRRRVFIAILRHTLHAPHALVPRFEQRRDRLLRLLAAVLVSAAVERKRLHMRRRREFRTLAPALIAQLRLPIVRVV